MGELGRFDGRRPADHARYPDFPDQPIQRGDEETQDYYGADATDTVASVTDVSIDPVEFTGRLAYDDDLKTSLLDEALGTNFQVGIVFKTGDGAGNQTARVFLGKLTRTQEDPAATGIATVLIGFNVRDGKVHRVNQA